MTPDSLPDEAGVDTIRAIQRELAQRGFGPVAGDGLMRPVTRAAIMSYEYDHRLAAHGRGDRGIAERLVLGAPATAASVRRRRGAVSARRRDHQAGPAPACRERLSPRDVRMAASIRHGDRHPRFREGSGPEPQGPHFRRDRCRLQSSGARLKSAEAR